MGSTLVMYTCSDTARKHQCCVTEETAATVIAASSYLSKAKEENSSANRFYELQRMKRTCPLVLLGPEFSSQRTWAACCTTSQPVGQNSNTSVGLTHTHGEVQGGSLLLFLHPSFRRRAAVELFERAECECVGWEGRGGARLDRTCTFSSQTRSGWGPRTLP